ncbi:hypothetical protein ABID29_001491 [Streptococcus rupicaprae]|uniref:Uncharacterized protein n=1 Tax=Streptococcus rupicaprae TaxID=759619 RepID=A0ABV2FIH4_9STRE
MALMVQGSGDARLGVQSSDSWSFSIILCLAIWLGFLKNSLSNEQSLAIFSRWQRHRGFEGSICRLPVFYSDGPLFTVVLRWLGQKCAIIGLKENLVKAKIGMIRSTWMLALSFGLITSRKGENDDSS